jgi:hypothetical protein
VKPAFHGTRGCVEATGRPRRMHSVCEASCRCKGATIDCGEDRRGHPGTERGAEWEATDRGGRRGAYASEATSLSVRA